MARKNLSNRGDLEADELRQRRDLYAIAIGLLLFYAAGGNFLSDASVGSLFSVHLKRPEFVLAAAWIGFAYFWWRFWLISRVRPWGDYIEDVRWQAGDSPIARKVAAKYVTGYERHPLEMQVSEVTGREGPVPMIRWVGFVPLLDLSFTQRRAPSKNESRMGRMLGGDGVEVNSRDRWALRWAWLRAFGKAAVRERAFSDYTAPHLFALLTVAVSVGAIAHRGTFDVTKPRSQAPSKVVVVVPPAESTTVTRSMQLAVPAAPSTTMPKSPNASPKTDPRP
jgi:hypothetical protein